MSASGHGRAEGLNASPWSAMGVDEATSRTLRALVVGLGILAAWGAARWAFCLPLLWLGVAIGWLALPLPTRRGLRLEWLLPLALVLAASLLVALDGELAVRHTTTVFLAVLLFGLARRAAATDAELGWLALGIAATSLLAFWQAHGGLLAAAGDVDTLPLGLQETAAARLRKGRTFGSAALPGHYAILLLTSVPLLWKWAADRGRAGRLLAGGALVCAAAAMYLTKSLAAAAIAVVVLAVGVRRRAHRRSLWAGLVVACAVLVAVLAGRGDVGSLTPVRLRVVNWKVAGWTILHHPFLGVGLGGMGQGGLTSPWAAGNITPYAHNALLQALAEFGLAGLPLVLFALTGLVRLLQRGARAHEALTLAVAVVPLHNLVDFSFYAPEVVLPWAILAGTLAARTSPLPPRALPSWVLLPILAGGSTVACLDWQAETSVQYAMGSGQGEVQPLLEATRWAPWQIRPVYAAAERALASAAPRSELDAVANVLAERHWVQPRSAGWAEARARLLLAQGRRGEALPWAREARRRAPARSDLARLEAMCR